VAKLQEQLERIKEGAKKRIPPEALTIMGRTTEDLRRSGIVERTLRVGDRSPQFSLPDADGKPVGSSELLKNGPLVVSFYRGKW